MTLTRCGHWGDERPGARYGIIHLCALKHGRATVTSRNQHAAISQQRGGMLRASGLHRAGGCPGACRGVVQLGRGGWEVRA